ncbi:MAG: hypothetical protein IK027_01130 [Deltaproteobacteria bacterium]|nr:hypothetical protein [Deltaproteobacteria bacterium]
MTRAVMEKPKVKFATQLSEDVLAMLRTTAKQDGRQIQAILDDALREYFDNRKGAVPRRHVLQALQDSMAEHEELYKALAK